MLLKLLTLLSKLEDVEEVVLELRALATALLITGLKADITLFTIVLVLPALALLENLNDEMSKIIKQQFKVMILNYPSLFWLENLTETAGLDTVVTVPIYDYLKFCDE